MIITITIINDINSMIIVRSLSDHPNDVDGQVVFDGEPDEGESDGLTGCYKVSLNQCLDYDEYDDDHMIII